MKKAIISCTLFAIVFIACNDSGKSETSTSDTTTTSTVDTAKTNSDTREFVTVTASGGIFEVELGKLAEKKAKNARVKSFANMLVTQHTDVNGQLKTIAANKNITIASGLDADQQKDLDDFNKKTSDFDMDYIKKMEDSHEKGINRFEKASKSDDSEIAAFANKVLPALRMHLDSARAIRKDLK